MSQAPVKGVPVGHRCTTAALIANIAHHTRSLLDWDARVERFDERNLKLAEPTSLVKQLAGFKPAGRKAIACHSPEIPLEN